MQRSTLTFISSLTIAGLAAFALTGCGSEAPTPGTATEPGDSQSQAQPDDKAAGEGTSSNSPATSGTAELSNDDATYTAELQFCSLTKEGDALFHGLAFDSDGNEVGYLDGDFTGLGDVPNGEARIDFGATGQFQSTDEFIALGSAGGFIVVPVRRDTTFTVLGATWDANGTELPMATLTVAC